MVKVPFVDLSWQNQPLMEEIQVHQRSDNHLPGHGRT